MKRLHEFGVHYRITISMQEPPRDQRRFRLDLAYDGRAYLGWQSQPGGGTVQDTLQAAVRGICDGTRSVHGAGRTDTGVSALGQVAHFDVPDSWKMDAGAWQRALNANLPPTIRVMRCAEVPLSFHSRFSAIKKVYEYRIVTDEVLPPLLHKLAWHQARLGSDRDMIPILQHYVGSHDFRAFSAKRHDGRDEGRDTVRTIYEADAETWEEGGGIILRFCGNGFLYRMVRFLVGTAVYAVRGRISIHEIDTLLRGGDPEAKAPYCAPADGLRLVSVCYNTD